MLRSIIEVRNLNPISSFDATHNGGKSQSGPDLNLAHISRRCVHTVHTALRLAAVFTVTTPELHYSELVYGLPCSPDRRHRIYRQPPSSIARRGRRSSSMPRAATGAGRNLACHD